MRLLLHAVLLAGLSRLTPTVFAQGTAADYERSAGLTQRFSGKVFRDRVRPHWLEESRRFWYHLDLPSGERAYYAIDTRTGEKTALTEPPVPISDTARRVRPRPSRQAAGPRTSLTFINRLAEPVELFWLEPSGSRRSYGLIEPGQSRTQSTYAGHRFLLVTPSGREVACYEAQEHDTRAEISENLPPLDDERPARRARPDSTETPRPYSLKVENHQLVLTDTVTGTTTPLTDDGTAEDSYQSEFYWSPDSSRVVVPRVRRAEPRRIHLIESTPSDQLQPKLHTLTYPKPGDAIDRPRLTLFDIAAHRALAVDTALFPEPWSLRPLEWSPDGHEFYFLYNQRGHQVVRLLALDGHTGAVRTVVEETSRTFIDYTNKVWYHWLHDTGEVLWMSERDGWNHLYLFDINTGSLKRQVTRGEWVVRRVERVDAAAREVWFAAMGVRPDQSPYYQHLCRVHLDTGELTVLTEANGTHTWEFAPDGQTFIARWSRVDQPPVTELRRSRDGALLCEVERADASALLASGWQPPECFVAKGRDGITDIYGIILRPTQFDPSQKYPVIEKIYAGPHDFFVPQSFDLQLRERELAELGFIIVQIDGMGTNWRSKAFHDVCWKNLHDAGFPDRIAWLRAAAARYPEMDLTRVGIYGGSAGGQSALRALIDHGDFYRAAAADCGCHDNRMDKIWWNEQWMSWPVDESYEAASNVVHAHRMQGHLLLTVGELDTNVDPASTLQVVSALIKADKDFELLILPGAGHGAGELPYAFRRRMDFFVRHLWGAEPRRP